MTSAAPLLQSKGIKAIEENLKFLTLETGKQLIEVKKVLDCRENCEKLIAKVEAKDDYIDNMKNVIESKSNAFLAGAEAKDKMTVSYTRAVTVISGNLEHIADHAVNIVRQVRHLKDLDFIKDYDYAKCLELLNSAIATIPRALEKRSVNAALKICRAEAEIDTVYGATIKRVIEELKDKKSPENLITTLFIFQYLERMGDCLLNIGEAVISIALGERIKIHQYAAVNESIGSDSESGGIIMEGVGETRSGTTIRKVYEHSSDAGARWVIFKEGSSDKLRKEKDNMQKWAQLFPGLVPAVIAFNENDKSCSMVVEYLRGVTYKDLLINAKPQALKKAMVVLTENIKKIWLETKKEGHSQGAYLLQLSERLNDVYAVHPDFEKPAGLELNGLDIPSFEDMIKKTSETEEAVLSPFSVRIHGDCNADNILYEEESRVIHFIDLHRSRQADYVQDVSVFIVSCFRLPIFDPKIRANINYVINEYFEFACDFAASQKDETFELRLALGLIRSFITSTRFELNEEFASMMYRKAVYLMEKIMLNPGRHSDFKLPTEILSY